MQRFDAIVVGAGPAGSTAAYRLARAGASVLLLDRATFPRDKPCGGGLTQRAVRQLPFPIDPVVEDSVDRFELRLGYRSRFERQSGSALVSMTQRRRLDAFLAERAAETGADFRDSTRVTAVTPEGEVVFDGSRVQGSVVIGADGVNGVTARALGLAASRTHGVALEGNAPYSLLPRERYRGRLLLELGVVPGGYGWAFPKGDHVNVGVGGWEREASRLREHLRRLCAAYGIDDGRLSDLRGYRLPMRAAGAQPARGRVLLVGDAAGLVDPLSGDGIYEALVSARLAAEAALAGDLESYPRALDRSLGPVLAASWRAKLAFDRFPRLTFAVARAPLVWGFFEQFVRGEVHTPAEARGLVRAPLRLVEALGK